MIDGDPGAESVFHWTADAQGVDRRGAGPMDASVFGRGAGEGFGVHICTGPVYVRGAEPGDVLEVRILDIRAAPQLQPAHRGSVVRQQRRGLVGLPVPRPADRAEEARGRHASTKSTPTSRAPHAKAVYNFRWTPQTDPFGVRHDDHRLPRRAGRPGHGGQALRRAGQCARVPIRPHFGVLAVAPRESGLIDSIPPGYFGGNLDNWRAGKGAKLFLPVSVDGALFSVGDPHASQGDSEVCGTAIECSLTGVFQLVLHKRRAIRPTASWPT